MLRRDKSILAVYKTEMEEESLQIESLKHLLLKKTAEIIYVTQDEKLYGIICLEDILNHSENGKVRINKSYTVLSEYNMIKASEIFRRKRNVHKIPVTDDHGQLLGDYSRWDDMLYIERNEKCMMNTEIVKKILETYETVYLAEPVEKKNRYYLSLTRYLEYAQIRYKILEKEKVGGKLSEKAICIFLNEDERKGTQALYGVEIQKTDSLNFNISKYDLLTDARWKMRLATYKSLLMQVIEEAQAVRLKIKKPMQPFFHGVDDKATVLFSELEAKGIKCFTLYPYKNEETSYRKDFWDNLNKRLKKYPMNLKEPWPKMEENKEFYGELYQLEDYKNETAQMEIFKAMFAFKYRTDVRGKYFNAQKGRRITCFQPTKYIGTIYFVGLCNVIGAYVEDQHTIASYLQKILLEKGYAYRVENCGEMMRLDAALDCRLQEINGYSQNDIILYLSGEGETIGIQGNSLEAIYEQNQIPSEWVVNGYGHCNYKVNRIIADSVFGMINPYLLSRVPESDGHGKIKINFHNIMAEYIQHKYLDQYFSDFDGKKYSTVGAIVMKGDPFHNGHRSLIKQAKQQVDFLIIFVMEEDEFVFPFEDRFRMIVDGTSDIANVMVVPNGDFIFSKNTFWEYYKKRDDETLIDNAQYDINIFADYIAKALHITHRFAGEEPKRKIVQSYNAEMKKILYQKGITYVEIPRISIGYKQVSSAMVRNCLKTDKYDKMSEFIPETTKKYLMKQLDLTIED